MTKAKAKRIHADEALPVWVLDAGHDGILEIYSAAHDRLELRRDGWLLDDDTDDEDGLDRLKRSATEHAKENE
jgi:hypothetical protein